MGFFKFLGIRTLESLVLFFLVTFMPGFTPQMEFSAFSVAPSIPLKDKLELNDKLCGAEHLFEGEMKGPEHIVAHRGALYTSIHGGHIVKITDDKFSSVVKFGKPCAGPWEESECGRPLGFDFDKEGTLYVVDAYYGLIKHNMKTGENTFLVSINDTIQGKTAKLPNSVVVASDGYIYWTDSSSEVTLEDGVYACLGDGSGRLIRYDPKTKTNEVLLDNLHFANGVALAPNEEFILVAETVRSRIHRYYLKGPKKGTSDIFIDGLPGVPDNLKSIGEKGFLVPLVTARDQDNILLFQLIGPYPLLRRFFARIMAAVEMSLQFVNKTFPHYYLKRAIHWIGHFESFLPITPKRFTLLQIDLQGNILDSFHCNDGSLSQISSVEVFGDSLYFGSPFNSYIGRVKRSLILKA